MQRSVFKWCLAITSSCRQLWCIVAQSLPYPEARELGFIPQYQSVIGHWPFPEEGPNLPGMPGEKASINSKEILQRRMQDELLTSSITAAGRWRHRPCTEVLVGTPIASTALFLSNTLWISSGSPLPYSQSTPAPRRGLWPGTWPKRLWDLPAHSDWFRDDHVISWEPVEHKETFARNAGRELFSTDNANNYRVIS